MALTRARDTPAHDSPTRHNDLPPSGGSDARCDQLLPAPSRMALTRARDTPAHDNPTRHHDLPHQCGSDSVHAAHPSHVGTLLHTHAKAMRQDRCHTEIEQTSLSKMRYPRAPHPWSRIQTSASSIPASALLSLRTQFDVRRRSIASTHK